MTTQVESGVQAHSLPEPSSSRWQLLRAGLQNIWEYDDQRFVFHRGRLLLRGRNEAGKSKALEVLLPFLLDGNLSPQRLDPFGSTSRKMRWNLINDTNPDVKVSAGYVWLEFGRVSGNGVEFCTIGAGLRAKRTHTNVDAWYFITSQRIDAELRTLGAGRVPLAKGRLAAALGDSGSVFDRGSDYRREVNRRLFGMPQDQYDTLVEALLQLRRPQLSKQLQPKELSRILSLSLPPLDAEIVGRLAEGFDRLDRHRAEREQRFEALKALQKFLDVYGRYARAVARARAQRVSEADSTYRRARTELREAEQAHETATSTVERLEAEIRRLGNEEAALATQIETLKSSDAYRAAQQLDAAEKAAREAEARVEREKGRAARAKADLDSCLERLEATRKRVSAQEASLQARARAAAAAAAEADLVEAHDAIQALADARELESAKGVLQSAAGHRAEGIRRVEAEERESTRLRSDWKGCEDRRRKEEEEVRTRQAAHEDSGRNRELSEEAFCDGIRSWAEAASVLSLSADDVKEILSGPLELAEPAVRDRAKQVRAGIDGEAARLEIRCSDIGRVADELQGEHDRVASQPHIPPSQPAWRADRGSRPGAPFYLLGEFVESLHPQEAARIEAALEAAGLLDAWLTPDGTLLDPDTFDVVLRPEPRAGRTLADVLHPAPASGVPSHVIGNALRTIALANHEGDAPRDDDCSCWVARNGAWRIGPLRGSLRKERAEFVGARARQEARSRRLAELAAAIAAREGELREVESNLEHVRARRDRLEAELDGFPGVQAVLDARTHEKRALGELQRVRELLAEASEAAARAERKLREAETKRDAVAAETGLARWIGELDELLKQTTDYRLAAQDFLHQAERHGSLTDTASEREETVGKAGSSLEETERTLEDERKRAAKERGRADALKESVGKERTEVLARLRTLEVRRDETASVLSKRHGEKSDADRDTGKSEQLVADRTAAVDERDQRRRAAEHDLQRLATSGLLPIAGIDVDDDPTAWSARQTLLAARRVQAETGEIAFDEGAREKAENNVVGRHQELLRGLPGDVHISSHRADGALLYAATVGTRTCGLRDLLRDLEDDVDARDRLLGEEERKLFESFLSGEANEHLGVRLRQAHGLVERMNAQLAARPTASGMLLRLVWKVTENAPAGTAAAIELILTASQLLSDADREALQRFLEQRLVDAREDESPGSLREKMLGVLDYRTWFEFRIELRDDTGRWKRMTKKTHAAGSGGQKAVMLHLPLFAAAAAFYEAASETSARLVMLDEAFAGIDREMRGQLMGLLAEFDLDFLMTSHEEWGFYEELDGLATYHLQRQRGIPGVYTDWFLWDGQQAHGLEAR